MLHKSTSTSDVSFDRVQYIIQTSRPFLPAARPRIGAGCNTNQHDLEEMPGLRMDAALVLGLGRVLRSGSKERGG